jgi:hypothetical protein
MVGAGFDETCDEAAVDALMTNVWVAEALITSKLDLAAWQKGGAREIYLVLTHRPEAIDGPRVTKDRIRRGQGLFNAEFDWLQPMFADPERGPWRLAAYFMLALAFISQEFGMPLPLPIPEADA